MDELLLKSGGADDAQVVQMKRMGVANRFVSVGHSAVEPVLSHEQVKFRMLLFVDELLQAFAGHPKVLKVLVAEMLADPI